MDGSVSGRAVAGAIIAALITSMPTACATSTSQEAGPTSRFGDEVAAAIDASGIHRRARHLDRALELIETASSADCDILGDLAQAGPRWDEDNGRGALRLLSLDCAATNAALVDAARGGWNARTGVTRVLALQVLAARGGAEPQLLDELSRDMDSDLVRATAMSLLMPQLDASGREEVLSRAATDSSDVVRRALGLEAP